MYWHGWYFQPGRNYLLFSCPRPWRRQDLCTMLVLASQVGQWLWSDSIYSEKKSFFFQEQCPHLHALQALSSKTYNSPWLYFPCFSLPGGYPQLWQGHKLLPPPSTLDWTISCCTVKRAFWWVHTMMFCLLLPLTWVHLSWCFSQMVTIRLQIISLLKKRSNENPLSFLIS